MIDDLDFTLMLSQERFHRRFAQWDWFLVLEKFNIDFLTLDCKLRVLNLLLHLG